MKSGVPSLLCVTVVLLLSACHSENAYMTDKSGKKYKTVTIGNQVWMAENLDYATSSGSWYFNNDSKQAEKYGRLYTWETACNSCPEGWHLPNNAEWDTLIQYLKNNNNNSFNVMLGGYRYYDGNFRNIDMTGIWWSSSKLPQNEDIEGVTV